MLTIDLSGQRALGAGAGQGVGGAIALTLAQAGADVVVNDLVPERRQEAGQRSQRCWQLRLSGTMKTPLTGMDLEESNPELVRSLLSGYVIRPPRRAGGRHGPGGIPRNPDGVVDHRADDPRERGKVDDAVVAQSKTGRSSDGGAVEQQFDVDVSSCRIGVGAHLMGSPDELGGRLPVVN